MKVCSSKPFFGWICTSRARSLVSVSLLQLKWMGSAMNSSKTFNLIYSVTRFLEYSLLDFGILDVNINF